MNGRLFVLCGPSGAGKTWLLNSICGYAQTSKFKVSMAPKYSTREGRTGASANDDVVQLFDGSIKPSIALGHGPFFDQHGKVVDIGKSGIDIAYALNDRRYGLSTSKIRESLALGDCALIVSDFRSIMRLRETFPKELRTVYIASAIDSKRLAAEQARRYGVPQNEQQNLKGKLRNLGFASGMELWDRVAEDIHDLYQYWKYFKPGGESSDTRAEHIKAFHTRYCDHISLFDHVILNFTDGAPQEMTGQMIRLIENGRPRARLRQHPPIFVVAAAPKAGKGTMLEMVGLIGKDRARLVSKLAGRNKKDNDKQDGTLAIGRPGAPPDEWPLWPEWWSNEMIRRAQQGYFPDEYDLKWCFHDETIPYAVSSSEIERNLKNGSAPIFISNMGQFDVFRKQYGDRVVFLYLFRVSSAVETEEHLLKDPKTKLEDVHVQLEEIRNEHQRYMRNIGEFDHVLLNTRPQDLYDQIFELLEHYHRISRLSDGSDGQDTGMKRGLGSIHVE